METVPGSGMPPASLLWTRIASTEIIYSCGFDFMTVPGRIATGKYCQHTPRSGELLRALYTGRSSDSGIKHSCSSSQGTASMSCEQLLCQHSNGFVRDLHPFPFSSRPAEGRAGEPLRCKGRKKCALHALTWLQLCARRSAAATRCNPCAVKRVAFTASQNFVVTK